MDESMQRLFDLVCSLVDGNGATRDDVSLVRHESIALSGTATLDLFPAWSFTATNAAPAAGKIEGTPVENEAKAKAAFALDAAAELSSPRIAASLHGLAAADPHKALLTYPGGNPLGNFQTGYVWAQSCTPCRGNGFLPCNCQSGWLACKFCSGSGRQQSNEDSSTVICGNCNGNGRTQCPRCRGATRLPCTPCKTTGKLYARGTASIATAIRFAATLDRDAPSGIGRDILDRDFLSRQGEFGEATLSEAPPGVRIQSPFSLPWIEAVFRIQERTVMVKAIGTQSDPVAMPTFLDALLEDTVAAIETAAAANEHADALQLCRSTTITRQVLECVSLRRPVAAIATQVHGAVSTRLLQRIEAAVLKSYRHVGARQNHHAVLVATGAICAMLLVVHFIGLWQVLPFLGQAATATTLLFTGISLTALIVAALVGGTHLHGLIHVRRATGTEARHMPKAWGLLALCTPVIASATLFSLTVPENFLTLGLWARNLSGHAIVAGGSGDTVPGTFEDSLRKVANGIAASPHPAAAARASADQATQADLARLEVQHVFAATDRSAVTEDLTRRNRALMDFIAANRNLILARNPSADVFLNALQRATDLDNYKHSLTASQPVAGSQ